MPADVRPVTGTGGGDLSYRHDQILASDSWLIAHNLGKHPSVTVVDSAGTTVLGDVDYLDDNHVLVSFAAPFSGTAHLN